MKVFPFGYKCCGKQRWEAGGFGQRSTKDSTAWIWLTLSSPRGGGAESNSVMINFAHNSENYLVFY